MGMCVEKRKNINGEESAKGRVGLLVVKNLVLFWKKKQVEKILIIPESFLKAVLKVSIVLSTLIKKKYQHVKIEEQKV